MQIYVIVLHDLIHYTYKCCITYAVLGEKHTKAKNNGVYDNRSVLKKKDYV